MAALGASAVSLYPTSPSASDFYIGVHGGLVMKRLKLVLTGQGGQTNTIGAHALGFETLMWASALFDDTNNVGYASVVDPVLNVLLLLDGAAAPAPVDVTSTASYITVVGLPRITPSLT